VTTPETALIALLLLGSLFSSAFLLTFLYLEAEETKDWKRILDSMEEKDEGRR